MDACSSSVGGCNGGEGATGILPSQVVPPPAGSQIPSRNPSSPTTTIVAVEEEEDDLAIGEGRFHSMSRNSTKGGKTKRVEDGKVAKSRRWWRGCGLPEETDHWDWDGEWDRANPYLTNLPVDLVHTYQ